MDASADSCIDSCSAKFFASPFGRERVRVRVYACQPCAGLIPSPPAYVALRRGRQSSPLLQGERRNDSPVERSFYSWEQAAHLLGFDDAFDADGHGRCAMRNFVFLGSPDHLRK